MVEEVGSCRRMVVVETCSLLWEKESSMVEVGSCTRMVVVETCSVP
jgi:3-dehydroquinate synthase class II